MGSAQVGFFEDERYGVEPSKERFNAGDAQVDENPTSANEAAGCDSHCRSCDRIDPCDQTAGAQRASQGVAAFGAQIFSSGAMVGTRSLEPKRSK